MSDANKKFRWNLDNWVPLAVALVLAVLGIAFREPLIGWFLGAQDETSAPTSNVSASAGDLNLATALSPDPPRQGENTLVLTLTNKAGEPVESAEVAVTATMPPMGSMPEMKSQAALKERGQGKYAAVFELGMDGTWTVDVEISSELGTLNAEYRLRVGTGGLVPLEISGGPPKSKGQVRHDFSEPGKEELRRSLQAYEAVRKKLAADESTGLLEPASQLAGALRSVETNEQAMPAELTQILASGAVAADRLGTATGLERARAEFALVSQALVSLTGVDASVSGDFHVFECSMTSGYNKWLQPDVHLGNPYKGPNMLTCGSELDWRTVGGVEPAPPADPDARPDDHEIHHYTCPMDTWVKQKKPGKCPACGMDLIGVTNEEVRTGVMRIDHRRRQLIGLRTAKAERRALTATIRAVGRVAYDESRLADVALKYDGFIKRLHVDELGQRVRKGQTLFTVYSPDLYTAQQEYLLALSQRDSASSEQARTRAEALLSGAKARLRLWDITAYQLAQLAKRKKPMQYVPIVSPASGYVVEKNVVAGGAIKTGQRLFRVAALDRVWIEADIYENDIPRVKEGQEVVVTLTHLPGRRLEGTVSFIYPYLDGKARTATVRIELPNKGLELKPDMYATAEISVDLGARLVVPESAVIYSGPRRIVFVDVGGDKLRPMKIDAGVKANGYVEVLSGVAEGDIVVISGNFLLSAESRLKSATGLW